MEKLLVKSFNIFFEIPLPACIGFSAEQQAAIALRDFNLILMALREQDTPFPTIEVRLINKER